MPTIVTSARFSRRASSAARASFSPTTTPILPPRKLKVEDQQRDRIAVERRPAVSGGVAAAELGLGLAKLVPVRFGVGKEERIGGRERAVELDEAAADRPAT